ncbi:MAG: HPr family phosphocarrier protein [Firmicutes bacterium]|jgi:phosphocarrier protein|nr:HPr family phosphocarrier protein [Bacillota bacterium]
MVSKNVKIVNEQGFHMRPASVFAQEMAKFDSEITISGGGKQANGKSVMTLIAGGFKCGTEVTVECTGAEEEAQLAKAVEMIEAGLGD